jgi:hypothetical protein
MPFFNVVLGFPGAIGFWSLSVYLAATMSAHRAAQDPAHRAAVVDAAGYEPFLFPHRRCFDKDVADNLKKAKHFNNN